MKFRLREGNGECRYYIGVEDSGNPLGITEEEMRISIETIQKMTNSIGATVNKIEYLKGKEGMVAEITISKPTEEEEKNLMEIRAGIIGEENSGKSTLVGCLISDKKDNGKGLTRTNVFRHRHEINCGKTSSFTHQIIGFDKNGKKTNMTSFGTSATWPSIVEKSVKIVNCIDMGCSEKSLNNSLKTLSPNYLDYIFVVISAASGITNNTVLFLKIALSLNIPVIVIITKIDLVNEEDFKSVLCNFSIVLKKEKSGKNPLVVKNKEDIVTFANNIDEGIMPIFLISNKTGIGLDYLNNFLSILPMTSTMNSITNFKKPKEDEMATMEFHFLEILHKDIRNGVHHLIVEGIVTKGVILKEEKYKFGPFQNEKKQYYLIAKVLNIHCKKMEVHYATKGQYCSVEIEEDNENTSKNNNINNSNNSSNITEHFRTGLVLLGMKNKEIYTKRFHAELWSMMSEKDVKMKKTYQPLVHIEHICQCVKIITENENDIVIPAGKSIKLELEFLYYPEYIKKNSFLIIVDNEISIYGYVKNVD